jgi:hypothetical protein
MSYIKRQLKTLFLRGGYSNSMKVKCYSVRLQSLTQISGKAYKASSFDGSQDIIPASQVFGQDYEVTKSDAYWISAWILEKKSIQYSTKKEAWFDSETKLMLPSYTVTKHIPNRIEPVNTKPDATLVR